MTTPATHESGHIVAALAVGWAVDHAWIGADGSGEVYHVADADLADVRRRLLVIAAGPVAETLEHVTDRRIATDPAWARDLGGIRETLTLAGATDATVGAVDDHPLVRRAMAEARTVLRRNWLVVSVLAWALGELGTLTAAEIHAVVDGCGGIRKAHLRA